MDSACLILLDQVGQVSLIGELFSPVLIPPAVESEIPHPFQGIQVHPLRDPTVSAVLRTQIDAGEAEVIGLALEMDNPWVLLDDKKARRVARQSDSNSSEQSVSSSGRRQANSFPR